MPSKFIPRTDTIGKPASAFAPGTLRKGADGYVDRLQRVPISKLKMPQGNRLYAATIVKYSQQEFAPPQVIPDEQGEWIVDDGNHRVAAAKANGEREIMVWMRQTTTETSRDGLIDGPNQFKLTYGKKIILYRNPTNDDRQEIARAFREKYPRAMPGTPKSRQTIDAKGNKYVWMADDAVHYEVENALMDTYGIKAHQNPSMLEAVDEAKRETMTITEPMDMGDERDVQVLVDPSLRELMGFIRRHWDKNYTEDASVKGLVHGKHAYWWAAKEAHHGDIGAELGVEGKIKALAIIGGHRLSTPYTDAFEHPQIKKFGLKQQGSSLLIPLDESIDEAKRETITVTNRDGGNPRDVVLTLNASLSDIDRLIGKRRGVKHTQGDYIVRGLIIGKDVYWWDGYEATHREVALAMGYPDELKWRVGVFPPNQYYPKYQLFANEYAELEHPMIKKLGLTPTDDSRMAMLESITEGVFDPYVCKAVFLAGGGGSGKGFFGGKAFGGLGLKVVNSDDQLEYLMKKAGLSPKTDLAKPEVQQPGGIRDRAKELTGSKQGNYLEGRLGIIIDGTASKPEKVLALKRSLEAFGYDCSMLLINTPLETALANNKKRDRVVPEEIIRDDWERVQEARPFYKAAFGQRFHELKPTKVYSGRDVQTELVPELARIARKLIDGPVENPIGRLWIEQEIGGDERLAKLLHRTGKQSRTLALANESRRPAWVSAVLKKFPQAKATQGNSMVGWFVDVPMEFNAATKKLGVSGDGYATFELDGHALSALRRGNGETMISADDTSESYDSEARTIARSYLEAEGRDGAIETTKRLIKQFEQAGPAGKKSLQQFKLVLKLVQSAEKQQDKHTRNDVWVWESLDENDPKSLIGKSWDSVDGKKTIAAYHENMGMFEVLKGDQKLGKTGNQLLRPENVDKEIAWDTKLLNSERNKKPVVSVLARWRAGEKIRGSQIVNYFFEKKVAIPPLVRALLNDQDTTVWMTGVENRGGEARAKKAHTFVSRAMNSLTESIDEGDASGPVNSKAGDALAKAILQTEAYVKNVARPVALYKAKGTFDEKRAPMLANKLVMAAGPIWFKKNGEKGTNWHDVFNPPTRDYVMKKLVAQAKKDAADHKYDALLPKKYQKGFKGYTKESIDESIIPYHATYDPDDKPDWFWDYLYDNSEKIMAQQFTKLTGDAGHLNFDYRQVRGKRVCYYMSAGERVVYASDEDFRDLQDAAAK
jgi:hypothetical protein